MCLQHIRKKKDYVSLDSISLKTSEEYIDNNEILDDIQKEVDTWGWYEKTLFEVYMYSGLSLRDLAYGSSKQPRQLSRTKYIKLEAIRKGTGISVSSMFHTLKSLKEKIRIKFKNYDRTK
jgi:hypothetical protein